MLPSLILAGSLFAPLSSLFGFGNDQAGTSGAAFLKIAPGARPVGMGEAFTAVADDVHAAYWNPAGLATLQKPEFAAMHMEYFQNINYEYAAFALPTKSIGTFGVSISNLNMSDLERRTDDTDVADGQFKASDSAYGLHYGRRVGDRLALGATGKFIRQTIDEVSANAFAADLGALYDIRWQDMKVGAAVQNLGSSVKFREESDPLPMLMRIGVSGRALERKLLLSSDITIPRDNQIGLAFGGEYRHRLAKGLSAAVRSGYRTDTDVDGLSGLSAGGGLTFGRASFDFAWVPFGDLGNAYRLSLHIKFGAPEEESRGGVLKESRLPATAPQTDTLEQLLSL